MLTCLRGRVDQGLSLFVCIFKLKLTDHMVKSDIIQLSQSVGLFTCLWYNPVVTVKILDSEGCTVSILFRMLEDDCGNFKNRFELKLVIQGIVSLLTAIRDQ